jgi:hypothetical protein
VNREVIETEGLEPAEAIKNEQSILEKFRGKARQIVKVLTFVSALSVSSGMVNEVYAQQTKHAGRSEQVKKQEKTKEKINEANLTGSSTWSRGTVEAARADEKKIEQADETEAQKVKDAQWLVKTHFNQFVSEYYMPTNGDLKEGPYGIKMREYSEDDLRLLLQEAREMKSFLQELNAKYPLEAFDKRMEQIDDMIKKLEGRSSYSGQKQKEALDKMEQLLKDR